SRRLCVDAGQGRIVRQCQVMIGLLARDLGRYQRHQFRLERVESIQGSREVFKFFGELVDTVKYVEDRPESKADRDIVAMLFPVEVAANRPEEVVEVRDLVAHVFDCGERVVKVFGLAVRSGGELLLQDILLLQNVDRVRQFTGLLAQVVRAIRLVGQIFLLTGALRADLKRQRAVDKRGSQ